MDRDGADRGSSALPSGTRWSTSSASPRHNRTLARCLSRTWPSAVATPLRKGSAPMKPWSGSMSARSARCSPDPKPISKCSGRSSPNSRAAVISPSAGHLDLRQQLVDQLLLALAQLVPARPAVEPVQRQRVAGFMRRHQAWTGSQPPRRPRPSGPRPGRAAPTGSGHPRRCGRNGRRRRSPHRSAC